MQAGLLRDKKQKQEQQMRLEDNDWADCSHSAAGLQGSTLCARLYEPKPEENGFKE